MESMVSQHQRGLKVRVLADRLASRELAILNEAVLVVNGLQTEFVVMPRTGSTRLPAKRYLRVNHWSELLDRRCLEEHDWLVCVTTLPFRTNDFQTVGNSASIITIDDWETSFAPPSLKVYLIYQFAFAFACWSAFRAGGDLPTHDHDTIGCRMDYCGDDKGHLKLGMLAGRLCGTCRDALLRSGASIQQLLAIQRILDYVRLSSLGSEPRSDWNSAFVVMRFSEADENQRAYEEGIRPGLLEVGIRPTRGDDFVESRQLLEKVTNLIQRARFVVAKIDEKRMNV